MARSTFIFQGYPPINSPFEGHNSLPGSGQSRETWTTSAFLGVRLWQGGELYYNPELLQGFGLANTVGAGGFPNGEAQKSNFPFPRYNTSRLFLRQEIGLGGEREKVESDYGQLVGREGHLAGHPPGRQVRRARRVRHQRLCPGLAHRFHELVDLGVGRLRLSPPTGVGLTYGISAELNQPDWAVRAGYFLMPQRLQRQHHGHGTCSPAAAMSANSSCAAKPFDRPGVVQGRRLSQQRLRGLLQRRGRRSRNTLGATANDTIAQTRQGRIKSATISTSSRRSADDIGVFARWSWNNGQNEIMAFTDIDAEPVARAPRSRARRWGRPDDTVGIAVALNKISTAAHQLPGGRRLGPAGRRRPAAELQAGEDHRSLLRATSSSRAWW